MKGIRIGSCSWRRWPKPASIRKELLEQVYARAGDHHYGEEIVESAEEKAEQIITEELKRLC